MIKKTILIAISFFLFSCQKKTSPNTVAKVGNFFLTFDQLKKKLKLKVYEIKSPNNLKIGQLKSLSESIVSTFIYRSLIQEWSSQNKIFVHPEELFKKTNEVKKHYPNNDYFLKELQSLKMSEAEWVNKMKFSLLEKKVLLVISPQIPSPTKKELKKFYNENLSLFKSPRKIQFRQIITSTRQTAEKANSALRNNTSFNATYKKYSILHKQSPTPQSQWIEYEKQSLFKKLFKLKKNDLSEILKSDYGYHIAQILDRKDAKQESFKEALLLVKKIFGQQFQKEQKIQWLKSQIKNKKIFINTGLINKLKLEYKGI